MFTVVFFTAAVTVFFSWSAVCPATLVPPKVTPGAALSWKYQRAVKKPAIAATTSTASTIPVMISGSLRFLATTASPSTGMVSTGMAGAGVDEGMSPVGMAPVGTAPLGTVPAGVVSAAPAVGNDWNGWVWSDAKFNGGMVSVAALDTSSCSDISATSARLIVSPFSPDCGGTAFTPSNEMPAKLLSVSFFPLLSDMYVVSSFTLLTVHTMQHDTQTSAQTNT